MRKEREESRGWGKKKESSGNKLRYETGSLCWALKLRPWQWWWWLVLSFEALAMEVVGLIQRWRDQVRREEKERERGLRLNVFVGKKKWWRGRSGLVDVKHRFYASSWPNVFSIKKWYKVRKIQNETRQEWLLYSLGGLCSRLLLPF